LAKLCDRSGDDFERVGDVCGGGVAAEAEANAGARLFWRHANRGEDVGRLDGAGGAGCSGGARKAFEIQRDDESFAFDSRKSEICGVWRAWRACGVGASVRNAFEEATFEFVAERGDARGAFGEQRLREFGGLAQADDAGNVLSAGTEPALMMAAIEKLA